jgi:outer membrane protein OmpA-like peptidoglycan-associated protein
MRRALPTLVAVAVLSTSAAAQFSIPGTDGNPFPLIGIPSQQDGPADSYRRLPYRDLASAIHIELPADALYNFDRGEVRASAHDYLQQAANLIFERAKGPVRIECRSDRGAPAAAQKLAAQCALALAKWLTVQEKLTNVKFTTVGASVAAPAAPNANDPLAPAPLSQSHIVIDFAKK